jgi:hypothetical protein
VLNRFKSLASTDFATRATGAQRFYTDRVAARGNAARS